MLSHFHLNFTTLLKILGYFLSLFCVLLSLSVLSVLLAEMNKMHVIWYLLMHVNASPELGDILSVCWRTKKKHKTNSLKYQALKAKIQIESIKFYQNIFEPAIIYLSLYKSALILSDLIILHKHLIQNVQEFYYSVWYSPKEFTLLNNITFDY